VGYNKQSHPTPIKPFPTWCCDHKTRKTSSIHEPTKKILHKPEQTLPYAIYKNLVPFEFWQKQKNKNKIQV
jgi:hypothetical protein